MLPECSITYAKTLTCVEKAPASQEVNLGVRVWQGRKTWPLPLASSVIVTLMINALTSPPK